MNELQIAKEVFMSLIKWFLIVLVVNNLVWSVLFFEMVNGNDATITQSQDGRDNYQELKNG